MPPVPTLLENCERLWDALDAQAVTTESGERVFNGHTTVVAKKLKPPINTSHYSHIRRYLIAMDCVRTVQAGSRHSKSVWILVQRPTQDLLSLADPTMLQQGRNENTKLAILTQTITDIQQQLGGLNVVKAMRNLEDRVTALEKELRKHGESTRV